MGWMKLKLWLHFLIDKQKMFRFVLLAKCHRTLIHRSLSSSGGGLRDDILRVGVKLNQPQSELNRICDILESNWYLTSADLSELNAQDAQNLNLPYRLIQMLQQNQPEIDKANDGKEKNGTVLPQSIKMPVKKIPFSKTRVVERQQYENYGLLPEEISESLAMELDTFNRFMTTDTYQQLEPKIKPATANVYIRVIKLALGWACKIRGTSTINELSLSGSLFASSEASSAELCFDYLQWLANHRETSPNYRANVIRALLKLAKYQFRHELVKYHDSTNITNKSFDQIGVVRELRKMHQNEMNKSSSAKRVSNEAKKWLPWPEFLGVVEKLKEECVNHFTEKGTKRTNSSIAASYQRCIMLGIFTSIPDRQRTLRELVLGKTLVKDLEAGNYIIVHGPDDYKTGHIYGERPPLHIAAHLTPFIDDFVSTWRPFLLKQGNEHDYLFASKNGDPPNADLIYSTFTRATYRLTGKRTNPHLLRDSIVTYLRSTDSATEKDLEALAIYMGHSLNMQKNSYDRRTKSQKVAPAIDLIQSIKPTLVND